MVVSAVNPEHARRVGLADGGLPMLGGYPSEWVELSVRHSRNEYPASFVDARSRAAASEEQLLVAHGVPGPASLDCVGVCVGQRRARACRISPGAQKALGEVWDGACRLAEGLVQLLVVAPIVEWLAARDRDVHLERILRPRATPHADIEGLRFNRAVAQIYELTNALAKYLPTMATAPSKAGLAALHEGVERLVQVVAPMMPHLAETCWVALGKPGLVTDASWPEVDPALLVEESVTVAVQVNGKLRSTIELPVGAPKDEVERLVLSLEPIARILEGKSPRKLIIVPDRIVNVVI